MQTPVAFCPNRPRKRGNAGIKVGIVSPDESQEAISVIADAFAGLPINLYIDNDPKMKMAR